MRSVSISFGVPAKLMLAMKYALVFIAFGLFVSSFFLRAFGDFLGWKCAYACAVEVWNLEQNPSNPLVIVYFFPFTITNAFAVLLPFVLFALWQAKRAVPLSLLIIHMILLFHAGSIWILMRASRMIAGEEGSIFGLGYYLWYAALLLLLVASLISKRTESGRIALADEVRRRDMEPDFGKYKRPWDRD